MKIIIPAAVMVVGILIAVTLSWLIADLTACRVANQTVSQMVVFAPVGTVVASFLSPEQFAGLTGEQLTDDPADRTWILADGREAAGSDYAKAANRKAVPDLRGMFIRGLNAGRADGKQDPGNVLKAPAYDRYPGHYQADIVGRHGHDYAWYPEGEGMSRLPSTWYGKATEPKTDVFNPIIESRGVETRPRNVAVYYYIKIND